MKNDEIKEFKTTDGIVRIKEVDNNRQFKKGDYTFLPVGFGFKIEKVQEDKKGLYLMDVESKRYIYFSTCKSWDNSLIKELGFRKIKLIK